MAAEAASFNTLMLSISAGLIEFKSFWVCCAPSIITNGPLPVYEGIPLINIVGEAPGEPLWITVTPDELPCRASSTLTGFNLSITSALTVEIEPDIFVIF